MLKHRETITTEKIRKSWERDLKDPRYVAKIETRIKDAMRQITSVKETRSR